MPERLESLLTRNERIPIVMGILNVTPDSFSDGGAYASVASAVARAGAMIEEGAGIIDVGPESTRPGSFPVPSHEQLTRAIPVIRGIRSAHPTIDISIDTRSAEVASAAIEAGASVVNDVSALRDDPAMVDVVSRTGAFVVLMHRRGTPATMQDGGGPRYDDVVAEIIEFLEERVAWSQERGIDRGRMIVDPGIGFGKRVEHNLKILNSVARFHSIGLPVLIGASRKLFIYNMLEIPEPSDRDAASAVCAALVASDGAAIIRTHAVAETVHAVRLTYAIRHA